MTTKRFRPKFLSAVIAATLLVGYDMPVVWADDTFELEEIIVTARRKEENLQDTPVAVSAFSGDSLAKRGIVNMSDLNTAVPGMSVFNGNGTNGTANVYIRGVGQRNSEPNIDSGVGIYLDGVYISRADGALLDMNDVASVQVLRGPQGTLFGKNTTGGAMLIETNRPQPELGGSAMVRFGNYDQVDMSGVLNIPLIDDTLLTRLSLMSIRRAGYVDNELLDEPMDDANRKNAIWQLRWLASDAFTADLNLNWSDTDQAPRGQNCLPGPNLGTGWSSVRLNQLVIPATGKSFEEHCLDTTPEALGKNKVLSDLGGSYQATTKGAAVTLTWDLEAGPTIKSISAWRNTEAGEDNDLDSLAITYQHRSNGSHPYGRDRNTDQYSQEFDFSGEMMDGSLEYVAGLYYFTEETSRSRSVGVTGPFILNLGLSDVVHYNLSTTDLATDNTAWAAFSQWDWNISEAWMLTGGLRYTKEKRELERTGRVPDPTDISTDGLLHNPVATGTFFIPAGTLNLFPRMVIDEFGVDKEDVDDDAWTPMVSLSYQLGENGFIDAGSMYLTVSKGYRSGGLSENAPVSEYKPEEVESIELGFKGDMWDRRLRMNVALFRLNYDDRQLTTIKVVNDRITGATINAAKSNVTGAEIETTLLPTDNLELTMNAAWYDGEIEEFEDDQLSLNTSNPYTPSGPACSLTPTASVEQCTIDRSGENLPRLPEESIMLAAQYYWNLSIGTVVPRIQYSKMFNVDNCLDRISCTSGAYEGDHEDLSARLSWISEDESWSASLYGTNLTDEYDVIGGTPLFDAWGFGGAVYTPPRMYGAEVNYHW